MTLSPLRRWVLLVSAYGLSLPAQALLVTREFTGSWFDQAKVGQGFNLDVADSNGQKTAVLYWYTFDASGRPLWLYGQSPVSGSSLSVDLYEVRGPRFVQDFQASQLGLSSFGRITLSFTSCTSGTASYSGAFGTGTLNLSRLTGGYGGTCTGTVVDDGKAASAAGSSLNSTGVAEIIRPLSPTSAAPAASGNLKYRTGAGRVRFSVEIEDVPVGSYSLIGGGTERATLNVVSVPGGAQGEVEFSSPADGNELPLDFDPRDMNFVVRQGGTDFLNGVLNIEAGSGGGGTGGGTGGGSSSSAPPFGDALTVHRFDAGAIEAKAELKQRATEVEFSVELEDAVAGRYDIVVANVVRGSVTVAARAGGGTYGETEFRNPVEPGKVLLDFDPRGQTLALVGTQGTLLSTVFPATPNGGSNTGTTGSGNSGGGNSGGGNSGGGNSGGGNSGGSGGTGFPTVAEIRVGMSNLGVDRDADGELRFSSSSTRQDFKVEVEDLDDGSYSVEVDGVERGTLNVSAGRAGIEYRNPVEPGKQLLDFVVQGKTVRVVKNGTAYLSGSIPSA